MSALAGTELPKPTDWQDFERKTWVLARYVLADPTTQLHGRQGQPQHGVDVFGCRGGDPDKLVGVQCKQKYDAVVDESELDEELKKALKFDPPLTEFILATTAPRDQKIQAAARRHTQRLAKTDRPIKVQVWGWEDIREHAAEHDEAWLAFDPSYDPFAKRSFDNLSAQCAETEERLTRKLENIENKLPSKGVLVDLEKARRDDTEILGQIKAFDAIAQSGSVTLAKEQLHRLKEEKWSEASEEERYRMQSSIASAYHQLGDEEKAGQHLLLAAEAFPGHEKSGLARAKAKFLQKDFEEALPLALELLDTSALAEEAASIAIQCRYFTGAADNALQDISEELADTRLVWVARVVGKRSLDDKEWRKLAGAALDKYPDDDFIMWFGADALLEGVLEKHEDLHSAVELSTDDKDALKRASALYENVTNKVSRKERLELSLANNASLAERLFGNQEKALQYLERGLAGSPDDEQIRLQKASILRNVNDFEQVLTVLPNEIQSVEGQILRAECLSATDAPQAALKILDMISIDELPQWLKLSALGVKARSLCQSEKNDEAKKLVDKYFAKHQTDPMYLALRLKVYANLDGAEQARKILDAEFEKIDTTGKTGGLFEFCYEAQRLGRHDIVVQLLEKRVERSSFSEALMILLSACIDGNYSKTAQSIFDELPDDVAGHPEIVRAQAVFSLKVGDPKAEGFVNRALKLDQTDLSLFLEKMSLLLRQGREGDVRRTLKNIDPRSFRPKPELLIALANMMARYGRAKDGLDLGYSLLMEHWDKPTIHLRYHGIILMNSDINDVLPFQSEVTENSVILLVNGSGHKRFYRIEPEAPKAFGAEHLRVDSDLAQKLLGKKVTDTVKLPHGMGEETWTVQEIKHPALDALHRSMNDFNRRFPRSNGLMQFEINIGADQPFSDIEAVLKASAERDENALDEYKEKVLPFIFIASLIGRDPIESWLGLDALGREFRVCLGNSQEREQARSLLKNRERKGFTIDPITLTIIRRLDLLEAVEHVCGPLHTTQSVVDIFAEREAELEGDQSGRRATIGYRDGVLYKTEITNEEIKNALVARREELEWVRANSEIVPAIPERELTPELQSLVGKIDNFAWEPAIAAQGQGLLLLSDDMGLRGWAHAALNVQGIWLQPVLSLALDEGKLGIKEYHEAITTLAQVGHSYVSLSAHDLFYQFEKDGFEVSQGLDRLLKVIAGPRADLSTNVSILSKFLEMAIASDTTHSTVCRLASSVFSALTRRRGDMQKELVSHTMQRISNRPKWLDDNALSWLIGHSMGMPYFQELLNLLRSSD